MSTINCKRCGKNFSDENNFCPNCGLEVPTVTYCRNCGNRVDNKNFCTVCGYSMNNTQTNNYNNQMNYQPEKPTSVMAIISMVLGILSFFCLSILASIPAIILSIIAIVRINKKNLSGKGYAIAGLITGIISTILFIFALIVLLIPVYLGDRIPDETRKMCCDKAHGELNDKFCYSDDRDFNMSEYYTCIFDTEYDD